MSISTVLDRIHTINSQYIGTPVNNQSTITVSSTSITVNSSRYFPRERNQGVLPLLTAVPGAATYIDRFGRDTDTVETTEQMNISLLAFVHNFYAGNAPSDAQRIAEELMEQIKLTYKARPRLEAEDGNGVYQPLSVLTEKINFQQRSDIEIENNDIAVVTFTIAVKFETTITKVIA